MLKRVEPWLWALLAILATRLIGMALFPLVDTTEPRYAEIARVMAETGDWITPWFSPGVPFWGKPPLSFWLQALSILTFGLSEFSLRLPAWLANLGLVYLTWRFARELYGEQVARWTAIIFASMSLTFISAGTVMTDPFLTLGTTLSLVSFGMVASGRERGWRWLFFLGLVIGLLAKGPLTLVLTGLPIGLWLVIARDRFRLLRAFPWVRGTLLTLTLALPWYIAAELKTPGFIDYFIVGEHFKRFLDPGWAGDLYGSAHLQPKGMIWMFWIWASFPWGIIGLIVATWLVFRRDRRARLATGITGANAQFVLLAALAPMLFFTMASNTLWTYVLPALPFSALVLARLLLSLDLSWQGFRRMAVSAAVCVPALTTGFVFYSMHDTRQLKTEQAIVHDYVSQRQPGDSHLLYLDDLPFSAQYYSHGQARQITMEQLGVMRQNHRYQRYFLAVPNRKADRLLSRLPPSTEVHDSSRRYSLLSFTDPAITNRG
ncbi:glycosyltransferase family 39 protein [Marinobacter halodurans]|uniref:Glycosyltransferase family 39 protein n=1 Tax=Marinobacter halodurans TaxID=2528979 RepID=A0ABY1ZPP7_9GAMM|nr:glycosyltransferase family 39 protein [Marinobacter halodurans]TBW58573.1 glycosyltransferase family 39 protein [Marinobacter halodurans]